MTVYSYFTVYINQDTKESHLDEGLIGMYTGGNLYDDERGEWFDTNADTLEGQMDLEINAELASIINGKKFSFG
jgi:hypothetical protein